MNHSVNKAAEKAVPLDQGLHNEQYLTFRLSKEMFAIGILGIREIMEYGDLTSVPMMPPFVRGVINLRGSVVPVIDLAARFGREESEINRRSCIVIFEIEGPEGRQEIGVIVDEVCEVLEIATSDIEPPPGFGARIRPDFIAGMGKVGQRFVIILDMQQVVDVEEMAELAQLQEDVAEGLEE
jgi:purine-binding chemotaxis protein CheW